MLHYAVAKKHSTTFACKLPVPQLEALWSMEVHGKSSVPLGAVMEFASEALISIGGERDETGRFAVQEAIMSGRLHRTAGPEEPTFTMDLTISDHVLRVACTDSRLWKFQANVTQWGNLKALTSQVCIAPTSSNHSLPLLVRHCTTCRGTH